jgi:hypothetical protein
VGKRSYISRRRTAAALAITVPLVVGAAFLSSLPAQEPDAATRVAALEAKLTALEREITLLEDTKAIKRLQRAYGYYADKKLAGEISALFAENATAEIGGLGVFEGRARIAELYDFLLGDGLTDGELSNHIILQGVVHVAPDGNTAKGRWRALIQLGEHGENAVWSEGPYENEYVKEGGVWKFRKLHWYMTVTAPYDPGWHRVQIPLPAPSPELPPDRPPSETYQSYPSAYLPTYHYDNPVSGRKAGGTP